MNQMTFIEIEKHFNLLSEDEKKDIIDFMLFLVNRKKLKNKNPKKKLLNVSIWNDEEINNIVNAGELINKWNLKKY